MLQGERARLVSSESRSPVSTTAVTNKKAALQRSINAFDRTFYGNSLAGRKRQKGKMVHFEKGFLAPVGISK
jgi:hypothetical protein